MNLKGLLGIELLFQQTFLSLKIGKFTVAILPIFKGVGNQFILH